MSNKKSIIAIDGPAGSGKSTVAKLVARKLGLFYIDTGAMYRALALKAHTQGVSPHDSEKISELAAQTNIALCYEPKTGCLRVFLDEKDVTEEIRKPYVTEHVSIVAKIKEIRERMVALQRKLAEGKRSILEGRDTTTVVFPDAYRKFYLDAERAERIHRRYLEMKEKNISIDEAQVEENIEERDRIDSTRAVSPLRRAEDACYIDTTRLSIDEVVDRVIAEIRRKQ